MGADDQNGSPLNSRSTRSCSKRRSASTSARRTLSAVARGPRPAGRRTGRERHEVLKLGRTFDPAREIGARTRDQHRVGSLTL